MQDKWRRNDIEGVLAELHPDVEMHPVPELDGPYVGHDGIRRAMAEAGRLDELHYDVQEVRDDGDRAVVLGRYRARTGGSMVDNPVGWVVIVRDGKIFRSRAFPSWREALDAGNR
jgi:ketosteroid isomerase-like protein